MFNFLRRSRPADSAGSIRQAVVAESPQPGLDPHGLTVLERSGSYSGRPVKYFRVFDPGAAAASGLQLRRYEDLDSHPELVVGSGHIERGGRLVLRPRPSTHVTARPPRLLAQREAHAEDERIVFPNGGTS
jgi:hypothetical protein